MRPGDDGYDSPYIDVDVSSMRDAAQELAGVANRLRSEVDTLMDRAALPLAALAVDSDAYSAYAFWWGRWSALVETAEPAVRAAARVTTDAADGFATVDEQGRVDLHLPAQG